MRIKKTLINYYQNQCLVHLIWCVKSSSKGIYGEGEGGLSDGSVEESFFYGAFHITTKYTKYKNKKKGARDTM